MKKFNQMKLPRTIELRKGWNTGGTLHGATVSQWHRSTWGNGLATCADFVTAIAKLDGTPSVDDQGQQLGVYRSSLAPLQPDQVFGYSLQLLQAVSIGTKEHIAQLAEDPISKWAFLCATQLGWLKVEGAQP